MMLAANSSRKGTIDKTVGFDSFVYGNFPAEIIGALSQPRGVAPYGGLCVNKTFLAHSWPFLVHLGIRKVLEC